MAETSRSTFLNLSSFQIMVMFRRGLFYSYLSIYLRAFLGMSVTETTLFATIPMIMNVLFATFIWGRLSDKFQLRRTLIIVGEIIAAIITAAVWYAHILPSSKITAGYVLTFGLSVVEIFWSMSNIGWTALLSDLYPAKQRTGLQGKLMSIGAFGRMAGILIGGMLYDGFPHHYDGWGFHSGVLFFIAAGVMMISTIPMFFVPEGGIKKEPKKIEEKKVKGWALLRLSNYSISRKYLFFLIGMVFIFFGFNSIVLLKSQYLILEEGFNLSSRYLSYIFNTGTGAVFIAGLFIKKIADKYSDEKLLIAGNLIAITFLMGYAFSNYLPTLFVSEFLGGSAMAIIFSSSYTYASRLIPPEKRGAQFSLYNAANFLSWGIPSTLITGPLVDILIKSGCAQVFSYRMSFIAAAILMIIGSIILLYTYRIKNDIEYD